MQKIETIRPWIKDILIEIRKEIKNDHLRNNPKMLKDFFKGKPINNLTNEEIISIYEQKILEDEELQKWAIARWIYNNSDLYQFFYETLMQVNPKVDEITAIPADVSNDLIKRAIENFGAEKAYIFSTLNEVAFSQEIFDDFKKKALKEKENRKEEIQKEEALSLEKRVAKLQSELGKMEERYEKKISSMKKKYFDDTEFLKNQVKKLQQKLSQNAK